VGSTTSIDKATMNSEAMSTPREANKLHSSCSSSSNISDFDGFGYPVPMAIAELILNYYCLVVSCGCGSFRGSPKEPPPKTSNAAPDLSGTCTHTFKLTEALCLLSPSWNALVTPFLFSRIQLGSTDQAITLLRTLRESPDRSPLIKSLIIAIPPPANMQDPEIQLYHSTLRKLFKRHLHALEELHLYECRFIPAMTYLKDALRGKISLKTLSIAAHGYRESMSTAYIWSILREFPKLEEFWFEFRALNGCKTETERRIPKELCLPNMKRLGISGAVISDESVEELCVKCPNLEMMEIDHENRFLLI